MEAAAKQEKLFSYLRSLGSCVLAFSGGLDSTYLLWAACRVLPPERLVAVTLSTPYTPLWELWEARETAKHLGVAYLLIVIPRIPPDIRFNPPDRCYRCKRHLFSLLQQEAQARGLRYVVDGTNADDCQDNRPGMWALRELQIVSPLLESGITKDDVHTFSRDAGLPNWEKAPCTCLLTRLPVGREIRTEELARIEASEQYLRELGFRTVRVRSHNEIARLELGVPETRRLFTDGLAESVAHVLKDFGYRYVSVELSGYCSGSMDVAPAQEEAK